MAVALTAVTTTFGGSQALAAASAQSAPSAASDLRVALNNLLQEHVFLAAVATGHALGGREAAFKAAAESLDANSVDLAAAIGAAYGQEAEEAFLPLWRRRSAI